MRFVSFASVYVVMREIPFFMNDVATNTWALMLIVT